MNAGDIGSILRINLIKPEAINMEFPLSIFREGG